jgi:NADH:ubiquinone oxidoreductase subunit 2 (subunit N)
VFSRHMLVSVQLYNLFIEIISSFSYYWGSNVVQKIAPIVLTSYLVKRTLVVLIIIAISVIVGSLGGINQTSIRKILTYSSVNHTG